MPLIIEWDSQKKAQHDVKANAILTQGEEAIRRAKNLADNFIQIGRHIDGISRIALQKRPLRKPDARLHMMLTRMEQLGRQIARARLRNLSDGQVKSLQGHLSAIAPLLGQNADHAKSLAEYWTEMRKDLNDIVALFNS